MVPRGGRWSKDNDGEGDESNILSREEWEEGEDEDSGASGSVDFVNGGGGAKYEDEEPENDTVTMEDDDSDVLDEHASLSTMTVPECPQAEGEALSGGSAGEREEEQAYHPSS